MVLLARMVFFAMVFFALSAVDVTAAGRRVALVIGNASYPASPLSNPKNDASDIAGELTKLGFDVTNVFDATKRDMDIALETFARSSYGAEVSLVYYAGHAMQYNGSNYLMPVDAVLQDQFSVAYQLTNVDGVRGALNGCGNCLKILILDACRSNPLADRLMAGRGVEEGSRGLAPFNEKSSGFIVVYATQPGKIAADGQGRNSPFATALLKELREPQVPVVDVFIKLQSEVIAATDNKQSPELSVSGLSPADHLFYLNNNESDTTAYLNLDVDDVAQLETFVSRFPNSAKRPWAERRIKALKAARQDEADRQRKDDVRLAAEAARKAALLEAQRAQDKLRAEQEAAVQQRKRDDERLAAEAARKAEDLAAQQAEDKRRAEQEAAARQKQERDRMAAEAARQADEAKALQLQQQQQAAKDAADRQKQENERIAAEALRKAEQAKAAEAQAARDAAERLRQDNERVAAEASRRADEIELRSAQAKLRSEQDADARDKVVAGRLAADAARKADEAKALQAQQKLQAEQDAAAKQKQEADRLAAAAHKADEVKALEAQQKLRAEQEAAAKLKRDNERAAEAARKSEEARALEAQQKLRAEKEAADSQAAAAKASVEKPKSRSNRVASQPKEPVASSGRERNRPAVAERAPLRRAANRRSLPAYSEPSVVESRPTEYARPVSQPTSDFRGNF